MLKCGTSEGWRRSVGMKLHCNGGKEYRKYNKKRKLTAMVTYYVVTTF
jgi:hypothetical protein